MCLQISREDVQKSLVFVQNDFCRDVVCRTSQLRGLRSGQISLSSAVRIWRCGIARPPPVSSEATERGSDGETRSETDQVREPSRGHPDGDEDGADLREANVRRGAQQTQHLQDLRDLQQVQQPQEPQPCNHQSRASNSRQPKCSNRPCDCVHMALILTAAKHEPVPQQKRRVLGVCPVSGGCA